VPQRVDDGLDVLLVDDVPVELLGVRTGVERRVEHVLRGVGEGDGHAGAAAGLEPGGVLELVDLLAGPADPDGADVVGEGVHLGVQVCHPVLQPLDLVGLGLHEAGEVGVAPRSQVGAAAVGRGDGEEGAAGEHDGGCPDPPREGATRPALAGSLLALVRSRHIV